MDKVKIFVPKEKINTLNMNDHKGDSLFYNDELITDYKLTDTSYGLSIEGYSDAKKIRIKSKVYSIMIKEQGD